MKTEDTLMKWLNAVRDAVTTAPALTIKNVSHYNLRIYANMNRCINMYSYLMSHLDIVCLRMCIRMYVFKDTYLKYVCIDSCIYIFLHISIMYMNILYIDMYEYMNIYMYMLLP